MNKSSKELLKKLDEQEKAIQNEINELALKLDHIRNEKYKIYTQLKLDSDDIECSYCGYFASKKENPDEAESYEDSLRKGIRWYCGNSPGCY